MEIKTRSGRVIVKPQKWEPDEICEDDYDEDEYDEDDTDENLDEEDDEDEEDEDDGESLKDFIVDDEED